MRGWVVREEAYDQRDIAGNGIWRQAGLYADSQPCRRVEATVLAASAQGRDRNLEPSLELQLGATPGYPDGLAFSSPFVSPLSNSHL